MDVEALAFLKEVKSDALIVREWLRILTSDGTKAWLVNMRDLAKLSDLRLEIVSTSIKRLENHNLIELVREGGKLYCNRVVVPAEGEKRIRSKLKEIAESKAVKSMASKYSTSPGALK